MLSIRTWVAQRKVLIMDAKNKIEREMARTKKLIEDSENIMKQVSNHLRSNQELALKIYKRKLAALEQELMKVENENSTDIKF